MSPALDSSQKYILGLDLGSASIGWAAIRLNDQLEPTEVFDAGVRIFDPGVEVTAKISTEEAIMRGIDRSKAVGRRLARQARRQSGRKRARQNKLFKLLQANDWLPTYEEFRDEPLFAQKHLTFNRLDKELADALSGSRRRRGADAVMLDIDQALPYVLRKEALERELKPCELGKITYHLSQRRGYRPSAVDENDREESAEEEETASSSKKGKKKRETEDDGDEQSTGKVEKGISDLNTKMQAAYQTGTIKAPLIGPYFGTFIAHNPHDERIRHRWTAREMFEDEFDLVWAKQDEFYRTSHPGLTPEELEKREKLRQEIRKLLFFQRPLASTAHLIGFCDLEPEERRAPWASLEAQQFRLVQKVNNLRYFDRTDMLEKQLSEEKSAKLVMKLQEEGDQTFPAIRKLLDMPDAEFNLQKKRKPDDDPKKKINEGKIEGNRVNAVMLRVFGAERWDSFTWDEKVAIVESWRTTEGLKERERVAADQWSLDKFHAHIWAENRPPADYCKLSRKAILNLLDPAKGGMWNGVPFMTARLKVYPNPLAGKKPLDYVPEVTGPNGSIRSLTNPAVIRALTEVRKVVNAVIRKHDKPYEIRIELARELRKNRKQRKDTEEANEKNHERRLEAARRILQECKSYDPQGLDAEGLVRAKRDDVTKMLLLMECHCTCPYTGQSIGYSQLFGGEVEIEHIIPQSMMVDNSFDNLTLTFRGTNHEKLDRTPWQHFGGNQDDWENILKRVEKFGNKRKLALFQLLTPEQARKFGARRLNDTRYTSKLAGRLLMTLYGGRDVLPDAGVEVDEQDEFKDNTGRRAIFVSSGMVTALLRDAWMLNLHELIGDSATKTAETAHEKREKNKESKKKDRSDHRHHALDAVVIGLTTESLIRKINTLSASYYVQHQNDRYISLGYRELLKLVRREARPECLNGERLERLRDTFKGIVTSHRVNHRLRGELHKAGYFGKERGRTPKNDTPIRHKRISIRDLSKMEKPEDIESTIAHIVEGKNKDGSPNTTIKQIVREFGETIRGKNKKGEEVRGYRMWKEAEHRYPTLPGKRLGKPVPIKKFTTWFTKHTTSLGMEKRGKGYPERNVETGEIAYVSFFNVQNRRGTKWKWDVVKLFDAAQSIQSVPKRERARTNIFALPSDEFKKSLRDDDEVTYRFSLMKGDLVEMENGEIVIVRRFESDGRIWISAVNAAGTDKMLNETNSLHRIGLSDFLKKRPKDSDSPQPIRIDPIGNKSRIELGA
jgi:CRISPR-associated endonuclease Csn1